MARSPSGPGLSAWIIIEVIDAGPDISIPGSVRCSGNGATFHGCTVASLNSQRPGAHLP